MSFILDALKKSEAERSRQAGPALHGMRTTTRPARLPTGIAVLLGVLTLNLVGLAYLLLRKPSPPPAPPTITAAPRPVAAPLPPRQTRMLEPLALPAPGAAPPPVVMHEPATPPPAPASVPSFAEVAASGGTWPELRLSLHAYDADASRRFILLNGMRLREGETAPDGMRVEQITEAGAILEWRGRRFMLPRNE